MTPKRHPPANNPHKKGQANDSSDFKSLNARAEMFLKKFSLEAPEVREIIMNKVEATDTLARLDATTFEELALKTHADELGVEYDPHHPLLPACPHCGSIRTSKDKSKSNQYYCLDCSGGGFAANYNSISSGSKKELLTYAQVLHCILRYETVEQTCKIADIALNTYYKIKRHLIHAMYIYLQGLRLYGHIQVDETYFPISYKGTNLRLSPLKDDDPLNPNELIPREARERGGPYNRNEYNTNTICVFVAVDDTHCYSCYAGVGLPGVKALRRHVDASRFLATVPEKDPFPYVVRKMTEPTSKPGARSLFICDGSVVLPKYATETLGLECYPHVFRKGRTQLKLPKECQDLNLQRVNFVHKRLQDHLSRLSGSSRYIKANLILFDFMFNSKAPANKEAISEILRILVRPHLGEDDTFYERTFELPDYLLEWYCQVDTGDSDSLTKLPFYKAYSYYLYDKHKYPDKYPGEDIPTTEDIMRTTGLSRETIYNTYRSYTKSNLHDPLIDFFTNSSKKKKSVLQNPGASIEPSWLEIYDRYATARRMPFHERRSLAEICDEVNKEFGTNHHPKTFRYHRDKIEEAKLRDPLPDFARHNVYLNTYPLTDIQLILADEYERIVDEYYLRGEKPPKKGEIYSMLVKMHPDYTYGTICNYVSQGKKYRREKFSPNRSTSHYEWDNTTYVDVYDEYVQYRKTHFKNPQLEEEFLTSMVTKYNLMLTPKTLSAYLHRLSKDGKREELPPYKPVPYKGTIPDKAYVVMEIYDRLTQPYVVKGIEVPKDIDMAREIAKETSLAPKTIKEYIRRLRAYRRTTAATTPAGSDSAEDLTLGGLDLRSATSSSEEGEC